MFCNKKGMERLVIMTSQNIEFTSQLNFSSSLLEIQNIITYIALTLKGFIGEPLV